MWSDLQAMEKTPFVPKGVSKGPSQAGPFKTAEPTQAAWRASTVKMVVAVSKVLGSLKRGAAPMYADWPVVSSAMEIAANVLGSVMGLRGENTHEYTKTARSRHCTHKLYSHACGASLPRIEARRSTCVASCSAICSKRLRTQKGNPAASKSDSLNMLKPCV